MECIFWNCKKMHFLRNIHQFLYILPTTGNKQKQPSRSVVRIGELKIRSKFTGGHLYGGVSSIKFFIEIALRHGCSPVNLLHIFRTPHLFLRTLQDGWFCTSIDRLIGEKHIITRNTEKYCIILYYAVLSDDNLKVIFVQDSLKVI